MGEFPVRRYEDALLHALWKGRGRRGWWLLEVPVGHGAAGRQRRIDAVVIHDAGPRVSGQGQDLEEFGQAVAGAHIEVIEAKKRLNFSVVGQVLAGTAMLSERHPDHGPMDATALVGTDHDAALRWFCHRERIRIVEIAADWGVASSRPRS